MIDAAGVDARPLRGCGADDVDVASGVRRRPQSTRRRRRRPSRRRPHRCPAARFFRSCGARRRAHVAPFSCHCSCASGVARPRPFCPGRRRLRCAAVVGVTDAANDDDDDDDDGGAGDDGATMVIAAVVVKQHFRSDVASVC